jgi:hypothetical protein
MRIGPWLVLAAVNIPVDLMIARAQAPDAAPVLPAARRRR